MNTQLQIMRTDGTLLFKSQEPKLNTNPAFSHDSKRVFYTSNINGDWYIEYRKMDNLKVKYQLERGYIVKPCVNDDCYYFIEHKDSVLYKSENGNVYSTGVELNNIARPDQLAIHGGLVYYLDIKQPNLDLLVQNLETKEVEIVMPLSGSQFSIQEDPFRVNTTISRMPETLLQSVTLID